MMKKIYTVFIFFNICLLISSESVVKCKQFFRNKVKNSFTKFVFSKACNCDLTKNYCDLLCCCDKECTKFDLKAFDCTENTTET